jgi:hypothetical protein
MAIGMENKVDLFWRDLVKLFGEPNKPMEVENGISGSTKTYFWEGKKNVIEFLVYKEGESLSLFIYDKKLNNDYKLSQFK